MYQLNFITGFEKSQLAIDKNVLEIYKIIRLCRVLTEGYPYLRRIIAVQLRILLCDGKNSLIYKIYDTPELYPLKGRYLQANDGLYVHSKYNMFDFEAPKIFLKKWLKQDIMFFERSVNDIPKEIYDRHFKYILNKLKKEEKDFTLRLFHIEKRKIEDETYDFYILNDNAETKNRENFFNLLNKIGYNNLNIETIIKLVGDKEGAHIDSERPLGMMFRDISEAEYTYIDSIADFIGYILHDYLKQEEMIEY